MEPILPRWASWTFLLYAGGLTILGASLAALATLADEHGDAAFVGYSLLFFVARRRSRGSCAATAGTRSRPGSRR